MSINISQREEDARKKGFREIGHTNNNKKMKREKETIRTRTKILYFFLLYFFRCFYSKAYNSTREWGTYVILFVVALRGVCCGVCHRFCLCFGCYTLNRKQKDKPKNLFFFWVFLFVSLSLFCPLSLSLSFSVDLLLFQFFVWGFCRSRWR